MSASLGLYRLQQVDRQIDRARAQLDTIRMKLANDAELRQALIQLENAKTEFHTAKHNLISAEGDAEAQRIKIEQTESSLYGGKVHNPKELQDLQKDVVSLKKHLATLEERQLDSMLKAESAENLLKDAQSILEKIQARLGSEHKTLLDEQSQWMKDIERLGDEREAAVNPIDSSLLAVYEELRKQKRGVAITDFSDNACASCGATLTAALQQNAKSSKLLAYCPSCGRILYAS